jgi:undecaprenyl-diphosphatase
MAPRRIRVGGGHGGGDRVLRVALAAHFVSDVLAGFALGAVWLGLRTAIFRPWRHIEEVRTAIAPTPTD